MKKGRISRLGRALDMLICATIYNSILPMPQIKDRGFLVHILTGDPNRVGEVMDQLCEWTEREYYHAQE